MTHIHGGMSFGAILLGIFLSGLLVLVYFSRPDISVIKSIPVITQGILAPAVFVGVLVWGLVEYSTPPGKNALTLLARFFPSFIVGGLAGGYLGYALHYGQYVIQPAYAGNSYAEFLEVVSFLAVFSMIWTVAWADTHGFRGGRPSGAKPLSFSESGPRKVKRILIAFTVFIVAILLLVPAGAELGTLAASGHQVKYLDDEGSYCQAPLLQNGQVLSVRENHSASSIAVDARYGTVTNEFDMPTHIVKNSTGANITEFYHTAYITSALSTGQVNQYAMTEISVYFPTRFTGNLTIGTGIPIDASDIPPLSSGTAGAAVSTIFNGTNESSFSPEETLHLDNSSWANFTIAPYMFLTNQNLSISYEIQTNSTSLISMDMLYVGNPSDFNVLWAYPVIQAMYLIAGIILLIFIPLSVPLIDLQGGRR